MKTRVLIGWMGFGALALMWAGCADDPTGVSKESTEVHPAAANDERGKAKPPARLSMRLIVCGPSGNCQPLGAEMTGDSTLERIYHPDDGPIDFEQCELDEHFFGGCDDGKGRLWQINGPA
jgi:hypothetical protein